MVVDVADYEPLLAELRDNDGHTAMAFRERLALTAYSHRGL